MPSYKGNHERIVRGADDLDHDETPLKIGSRAARTTATPPSPPPPSEPQASQPPKGHETRATHSATPGGAPTSMLLALQAAIRPVNKTSPPVYDENGVRQVSRYRKLFQSQAERQQAAILKEVVHSFGGNGATPHQSNESFIRHNEGVFELNLERSEALIREGWDVYLARLHEEIWAQVKAAFDDDAIPWQYLSRKRDIIPRCRQMERACLFTLKSHGLCPFDIDVLY